MRRRRPVEVPEQVGPFVLDEWLPLVPDDCGWYIDSPEERAACRNLHARLMWQRARRGVPGDRPTLEDMRREVVERRASW